jgi:very-short-patch-repair endonuclease
MHSADSLASGALADILRRQHHVIGRDQALACGLSRAALRYHLRASGPWQTLLPGVYRTMTGPVSAGQRDIAALLHAGPRSAITGMAAARHFGFQVPDASPVDVVIPMQVRRQSIGFVRVQRSERMPVDVCAEGEIRFVLPARAVADAARRMRSAREVRVLIAETVQQQRCTIEMLNVELEQGPAQGSAFLRAALAEVREGIRSAPEGDLRVLLRRERVPMPMFNARLYDEKKTLIAVADAWWEDAGVAAEVDSREYHYSAEDWQRTMRRHDRLVARGVLVLHFTPARIRAEPQAVAAEIRSALIAGRDRPRLPIRCLPTAA